MIGISNDRNVTVKANLSLDDLIESGSYSEVVSLVNDFAIEAVDESYEAKMVMVCLPASEDISPEKIPEKVRDEIKKAKLRPAKIVEFLSYGAYIADIRRMSDCEPPKYGFSCLSGAVVIGGENSFLSMIMFSKPKREWSLTVARFRPSAPRADMYFLAVRE